VTATRPGILAIFNNVTPGREAEFEEWFQREHLHERLAVPGFLLGRRHEAVEGEPRYFNFYVTRSVDVLKSAEYRNRLNDPTPLTRTVMSQIFKDMIRTVCEQTFRAGDMRGAVAVTARFAQSPEEKGLKAIIKGVIRDKGVTRGEIWSATHRADVTRSEEERLRGGDLSMQACLVLETLRVPDAERIAEALASRFAAADIGVYRLLCEIRSSRPEMSPL
jgi:hypothetical protein